MRAAPFYVHSGEWSKLCFVLIPDTSFVERIDQPPCRTPQLVTAFLCLAKTKQISSCPIANCVSPARKCSCDVIFLHLQNDDEEWCHLHLMSSSKRKAIGRETNCLTDSQEKNEHYMYFASMAVLCKMERLCKRYRCLLSESKRCTALHLTDCQWVFRKGEGNTLVFWNRITSHSWTEICLKELSKGRSHMKEPLISGFWGVAADQHQITPGCFSQDCRFSCSLSCSPTELSCLLLFSSF